MYLFAINTNAMLTKRFLQISELVWAHARGGMPAVHDLKRGFVVRPMLFKDCSKACSPRFPLMTCAISSLSSALGGFGRRFVSRITHDQIGNNDFEICQYNKGAV